MTADAGPAITRPIPPDLERGIRLEVLIAPVVVLLPLVTAAALGWQGLQDGNPRTVLLGLVVLAGNVLFDVLMLRAIRRALRRGPEEPATGS